jgi:hypothetical protein
MRRVHCTRYIAPWHCCLLYAPAGGVAGWLACDAVRHRIDERLVDVEHEWQRALARRDPASRDGHEPRKGADGKRNAKHLRRDRCDSVEPHKEEESGRALLAHATVPKYGKPPAAARGCD